MIKTSRYKDECFTSSDQPYLEMDRLFMFFTKSCQHYKASLPHTLQLGQMVQAALEASQGLGPHYPRPSWAG